jgi:hypothetical protein
MGWCSLLCCCRVSRRAHLRPKKPLRIHRLFALLHWPKPLACKITFVDYLKQSIEMLANAERPSPAEKAALVLWLSETQQCMQLGHQWRADNLSASVNALLEQNAVVVDALTADLYRGKISYGEFARAMATNHAKLNSEVVAIEQKQAEDEALQQERQANEEQRRKDEQAARHREQEWQRALDKVQREQARLSAEVANLIGKKASPPPVAQPAAQTRLPPPLPAPLPADVPPQLPLQKSTTTNCTFTPGTGVSCTPR